MNNITGTIGLCRKAGKLIYGFDAVADEIKSPKKKVKGVIIAKDLSEKSKKEVRFVADRFAVPVTEADVTLDELGKIVGKRTGIIGILDEGFYKSLTKHQ